VQLHCRKVISGCCCEDYNDSHFINISAGAYFQLGWFHSFLLDDKHEQTPLFWRQKAMPALSQKLFFSEMNVIQLKHANENKR